MESNKRKESSVPQQRDSHGQLLVCCYCRSLIRNDFYLHSERRCVPKATEMNVKSTKVMKYSEINITKWHRRGDDWFFRSLR